MPYETNEDLPSAITRHPYRLGSGQACYVKIGDSRVAREAAAGRNTAASPSAGTAESVTAML
jgi:hypothetical protein